MDVQQNHDRIKVFSDGSRNADGAGSGGIVRVFDETTAWSGVRLGDRYQVTVLETELAGILLALHVINRLRTIDEATIYCNSQLAIACVEGVAHGAPKALLKPILLIMRTIRARTDCLRLDLKWCPAHCGVRGNFLAEQEAIAATRGKTYRPDLVPRALANYKPSIGRHLVKLLTKEDSKLVFEQP
ncbi:Reverse transcriptase from transposon X-element protein [Ceratobasidium sp. AG-Ba]|nr:Reverse transcriptase from transposon X-element protein [Ceratobasidium sp. AG-Ba]